MPVKKNLPILLFLYLLPVTGITQQKEPAWDLSVKKNWPPPFQQVQIKSTSDSSIQQAWYYPSTGNSFQPLIISLHTWSGDFQQEDPLASEALLRNWNYIHPDFRGINNRPDACGSPLVIADIEDAIRFAIEKGKVDTQNIHIIGVSGGGYATLLAYMQIRYPVKSFSAWVPISDLRSWYWESKGRKAKYADDIEKVAMKNGVMDWKELDRRSPIRYPYPAALRKNASLHIYAGVHDGYTGSVPISQSMQFYNKIAAAIYPDRKELLITEPIQQSLLTKRLNPDAEPDLKINSRQIHFTRSTDRISITLFEGGHEMLVPSALTLVPADNNKNKENLNILAIGDSNGAAANGWPVQLQKLLPYSTIINTCISGNTIGFDNLGQEKLNTLKNITRYLEDACQQLGPTSQLDYIMIGLGTNDTKAIFKDQQKEVPDNLSKLMDSINHFIKLKKRKIPSVFILLPPPVDEQKADIIKYGGAEARLQINNPLFRKIAMLHQATTIDLHKLLLSPISEKTTDGIHLTEPAQFSVASLIVQAINTGKKK
jgi:lysophospholipase L1-like esterase/pimeloyl-ACP methyl ester carboxylesterase